MRKSEQETRTWQAYLAMLVADAPEKQRIAREVRVQPITLQRWITRESRPREEKLRRLLRAIPEEHAASFFTLVAQDFPGLEQEKIALESTYLVIPQEFYVQVFSAYANTPPVLFRQALFDLILQQMLKLFDPDRQGMSFSIVCCVPPRPGNKVRSLRQVTSIGTPPWKRDDVLKTLFLGSESLAGEAVSRYRRQVVNRKTDRTFVQIHWTDYEESAGAFPIARQARVAGCLIVSSAYPDFFTKERQDLLEHCASVLALAFEQGEFFDLGEIALCPMPLYSEQAQYFRNFGQRVSQQFSNAQLEQKSITIHEARQKVWQAIEEEMLRRILDHL